MASGHLNFTAFSDETGSITNNLPEIFGGSIFVIEDSKIDESRAFLKQRYKKGIHCSELRNRKLLKITEEVGTFLKKKNCCAVTAIQINKTLMKDYKLLCYKKCLPHPTSEQLSLLKRFWYYAFIQRFFLSSLFNLIQPQDSVKITLRLIIEDFRRDKDMDYWDLQLESFNRSLKTYESMNIKIITDFIKNIEIKPLEFKSKKEEIMFSFPDLFAYAVRRVVTHKKYEIYNGLKHIFNKSGRYECSNPEFFEKNPYGIYIKYLTAGELYELSQFRIKMNNEN